MANMQLTRRTFFKKSAATFAMPYVITSSALGSKSLPSANDRIGMGCIGMGGQGTANMGWRGADVPNVNWVPKGGFLARGVQVVAVCDVNQKNLYRARDIVNNEFQNKDCAIYKDYHELLARKDIDVILCATGD